MLNSPWGPIYRTIMQRLTAKFLLLFALVGTLVPLALAVTAAPVHACCLRKAVHHCHSSEADQRTVRGTGCCNHDCCRAVTTAQWASPQPSSTSLAAYTVDARLSESHAGTPASQLLASQSTRAPPQAPIA